MRVRALIATGIIATTLFIPAHTAIALDGPRADKSNGVVVSNQQPSNNPKSDSGGTPKEFGEPSSSSESNMGPSTSLDSSIEEGAGSPFGSGSSPEEAGDASDVEESGENDQLGSSQEQNNSSLRTTGTVDKDCTASGNGSSLENGSAASSIQ